MEMYFERDQLTPQQQLDAKLTFVRQRQEFQSKLTQLLADNPNSRTVRGLGTLAHQAQHELYICNGRTKGFVGETISAQGLRLGAAIPATLFDRVEADLRYESNLLNGWLSKKGLAVEYSGSERTNWNQVQWNKIGNNECSYFDEKSMTIGATSVLLEHVAAWAHKFARKFMCS